MQTAFLRKQGGRAFHGRTGLRRSARVAVILALASGGALFSGPLFAQTADRVLTTEGAVSGKIVSVSANDVDVEDRSDDTKKVTIDKIRDVQFGGEPQSLRSARSMLSRGRAAEALEEVGKIEASERDGAEQLLLDEVEFVKAAAAGRAALASGADPKDAGRLVNEFLTKHPKSHHYYEMKELIGDLFARAG